MIIEPDPFRRVSQCRDGVHKTRGQPSEASAAEGGLRLALDHIFELSAIAGQQLLCLSIDPEIDQCVEQKSAREKLRRYIVDLLLSAVGLTDRQDPLDQQHQNMIGLLIPAFLQRLSETLMGQLGELALHIHQHDIKDHISVSHGPLLSDRVTDLV